MTHKHRWYCYPEAQLILIMTSPFWGMVPLGYLIFWVGTWFGWYPEGGWLTQN